MFENSLIESARKRKTPGGLSLPVSVAVHTVIVGGAIAASLWFVESDLEPPIPVIFHNPGPPPPVGTTARRRPEPPRSEKPRFIPRMSQPVAILKTLSSAAPEPETTTFESPGVSEDGGSQGVSGGLDGVTGTSPDGEAGRDRNIKTPIVIGGDVRPPRLIRRVEPVYPETERKLHKEGIVILEAVITDGGTVEDLRVLKSVDPILDDAARRAVLQWRYEPATLNGRTVRVFLTVTVTFSLH